jgi:aminoglycoside 6-adenylyltransferase
MCVGKLLFGTRAVLSGSPAGSQKASSNVPASGAFPAEDDATGGGTRLTTLQPSGLPSVQFLERITAWAERRDDIVAAVLTGSRVRDEREVDEFSDLDIELFTNEPSLYAGVTWLAEFGNVLVCLPLDYETDGYTNRLVFFEGGVKVDFQVRPPAHLDDLAHHPRTERVWGRGFRFLVDKVGARSAIPVQSFTIPPNESLSEESFIGVVNEFWFEAAHIPRYLLRDELWVVKFRDWTMKCDLLKMIEWYARARRGDEHDVWYIGTKMKSWVDEDVWTELQELFARFDRADSWRALLAMMALFARLTRHVSEAYGFAYPEVGDRVSAYVHSFAPRFA